MKLLTFTIPCYNSEAYMEKCIDSILPGGEDVEIIIVDDGSKDRIGVENGIGAELVGQFRHLGDGHDGANLVIHHHNGHQNGILPQGGLQGIQGDTSQGIRLEVGHIEALGFQLLHAVQDGMVLNGGGDDVFVLLAIPFGGAENGPVVGLGATGGEEDPVRLRAHSGGHGVPGGPEVPGGVDAEAVQGAGIAPVFRQGFCNGLHSLSTGLRGGRIVKIDHDLNSLINESRAGS